jgi:hypothetical protein
LVGACTGKSAALAPRRIWSRRQFIRAFGGAAAVFLLEPRSRKSETGRSRRFV